ncbi:MAG: hypothetical protein ACYDAC_11620 [Candidatus Dormibacteria bacterium]
MTTTMDNAATGADRSSPLVAAAQKLVQRIETLVDEVARLRADNAALRRDMKQALAMFESAGAAVVQRSRVAAGRRRAPASRGPRRTRGPKGRATPAEVTSDVVRAVLVKLGEATAAEVAAEINRARATASPGATLTPVGGRAVRFLAERAGAAVSVGADGQRRYRAG